MNDRIYRTREDRMFLGVLGGFSLRFGIDPSIVRIAFAIVTVITGIVPLVILYFVMAIVIPEAPAGYEAAVRAGATGAPPPPWAAPAPPPPPAAWPPTESSMPPAAWTATTPPAAAAVAAGAPAPGPAWGASWDASRRPASGETEQHARDARTGAIVGGLVLVGLGGAFLLAQVAPEVDWGVVGPVLLILLGAVLVLASFRRA